MTTSDTKQALEALDYLDEILHHGGEKADEAIKTIRTALQGSALQDDLRVYGVSFEMIGGGGRERIDPADVFIPPALDKGE